MLMKREERTSLYVIVAPILHKVFYCLARKGTILYFIKNYHRIARVKSNTIYGLKAKENKIKVHEIFKQLPYFFSCPNKVYSYVGAIFISSKFLSYSGLADTSSTLDEKSCRTVFTALPLLHFIIDFTLKYTFSHN